MSNCYRVLPCDIFSLLYHLLETLTSNGFGFLTLMRVLAVGISVAVVSGCMNNAPGSPPEGNMSKIVITQADQGQTFNVRKGDALQIDLQEKPGAAYQWKMEIVNNQIVELQETRSPQMAGTGFGGSSIRTFVLKAQLPGVTQVRFNLKRDWEAAGEAINHFEVTISVYE
jgi:predicted secreted protein